jgi:hypothetical protein
MRTWGSFASYGASFVALVCGLVACGPGPRAGDDDDGCLGVCSALGYQECVNGELQPPVACEVGQVCDPSLGCTVCIPDNTYCVGTDEIWQCNGDGTGGMQVDTCEGDLVCSNGECQTPCDAAAGNPSNVGCDFWSVDLDNEPGNAARETYAIVLANNNDAPASVRVTKNVARVGVLPQQEETVATGDVPAHGVLRLDLPQREVDGTMGQNGTTYAIEGGSHTFVSSHAYHVVSSLPVVAYQFNAIRQIYSNDASTLIPIQAMGTQYDILGFPTANPCAPGIGQKGHIAGLPDHTAVTIVATQDDTHVTFLPTHRIHASGGDSGLAIPQTEPGTPITMTLNKYDVANLESWQMAGTLFDCFSAEAMANDGDQTGSVVSSDKPVAVFTAHERGLSLGDDPESVTRSPNWNGEDFCCTEHFEEQLFPTTALGREFAVARSAVRSTDPSWKEPDIYRVLATENGTQITTNLPGPYASFTLNRGEHKDFWSQTGFALSATRAVELVKILVPQQYIPDGFIGDPSYAMHPAAEQYRTDYVFLVPDTWEDNYMVLSRPAGVSILFDGMPLGGGELDGCYTGPIGMVAGVMYDQLTCPIGEGSHTLTGDRPFGLMVFGYYSVGAYSFAGGSDVKIINPIE